MRRREFITLLGGAAAWPLSARAQQAAIPVIGFLNSATLEGHEKDVAAFRQGLNETGFVAGRNVAVEYHWAEGAHERLTELVADLVRRRVAVIVTPGSFPAARAAKAATATTPIVYDGGADPVRAGLVASLNRPGSNVTGFVELNSEIVSKRLGLLHDLIPGALRFALLVEPNSSGMFVIADLQKAASAVGLQIEAVVTEGTDRAIDAAFASLTQRSIDAVMVSPSPLFYALRVQPVRSPRGLEQLERQAMEAIRKECPGVEWLGSYAVLGPCDYLDVFLADEIDTATRVSALIRTFGHAHTEIWAATEWDRFKELVRTLPGPT